MANKFTLFILVLFWGYQTSAQNLLTNGSFENGYGTCGIVRPSPCVPTASCAFCAPGEPPLGWTWISGNMDLYDADNSNSMKGQLEVKKYYSNFFQSFKEKNQKLLLTFKVIDRKKVGDNILDNGFYRLEIITSNKPSSFSFGKFSTVLELQNDTWKFKTDATTNTEFIEYENALSKTIPKREELLYPQFYDELLGDYITEQNQLIVIGRSQIKLFAYFEKTNEYRGLNKVNATTWTAGNTIKSNELRQTFKFKTDKIEIYENQKLFVTATKK